MVILPWSVNVCNVKWLDEVLLDNKYILVIPCLKSFEHSPTIYILILQWLYLKKTCIILT